MEAKINDIYFTIGGENKVYLALEKADVEPIDYYDFTLTRKFQTEIEMSRDDSDGYSHSLVIGFFVDGTEVRYVTDWFPNDQEKRVGLYAFDVPGYAKYRDPKKYHTVQIKLGERKWLQNMTIGGKQVDLRAREYNLYESPVFYYKVERPND